MKKLFLNTISYEATIIEAPTYKVISFYEDKELLFEITHYHRAIKPNTVNFNKHVLVPIYVIQLALEVDKDFNQHFNYLKLQK